MTAFHRRLLIYYTSVQVPNNTPEEDSDPPNVSLFQIYILAFASSLPASMPGMLAARLFLYEYIYLP